MEPALLLKIFILRLIDKHRLLDNQYGLTRFFAKSFILPDKLYKTLNELECDSLINVKDVKYTVKYYDTTELWKQLLIEKYSINNLKDFLHDIEPTDSFINILVKIEEAYNE